MNLSQTKSEQWYAIYTKSRFEKKLYNTLQKSGFQAFLPLIKEKRIWSDRIKTIEAPLLPSYVFVKLEEAQFSNIYYLSGFVKFVSFEGKPCTIKETDISLMTQLTTCGFKIQKAANCIVGDVVRIVSGPLKGWEGRVENTAGKYNIIFNFDCIQQSISVQVSVDNVKKIFTK